VDITCPICGAELHGVPDDFPARPFCSFRCKRADLLNWLEGKYRVSEPLAPDEVPESTKNPVDVVEHGSK
jgi:endogenous inhibitor of DNA gyrase (YacG/DUF329 family)